METEKSCILKLKNVCEIGFAFGIGLFLSGVAMFGIFTGLISIIEKLIN